MSEAKLKKSKLDSLIKLYPNCVFCGGLRPTETQEHLVPSALFKPKPRPNELVLPSCRICNNGSSFQDAIATIIFQASKPYAEGNEGLISIKMATEFHRKFPKVPFIFKKSGGLKAFLKRQEAINDFKKYNIIQPGEELVEISDFALLQLRIFSVKIGLGLYFSKTNRIFGRNKRLFSDVIFLEKALTSESFQRIIHTFPQFEYLKQGKMNSIGNFEYSTLYFPENSQDNIEFAYIATFGRAFALFGCSTNYVKVFDRPTFTPATWQMTKEELSKYQ
jgi:hypothetical protein